MLIISYKESMPYQWQSSFKTYYALSEHDAANWLAAIINRSPNAKFQNLIAYNGENNEDIGNHKFEPMSGVNSIHVPRKYGRVNDKFDSLQSRLRNLVKKLLANWPKSEQE